MRHLDAVRRLCRRVAERLDTSDEDGMETSEVVLILALVVIGVYGAWRLFKDQLSAAIERTGEQISENQG